MLKYRYPQGKEVFVHESTVQITPGTFGINGNYWESESLSYFYDILKKKDISGTKVFVDIGAQTGLYSLLAKDESNIQLFSYEPNPETYNELVKNCKLNMIDTTNIINKAIGSKEEKLILRVPPGVFDKGLCTLGTNVKRFTTWYEVEVDVTTLDKEFYEKNIPVHFIKCDTEGWELNVIKGGKKTIEKWHPELFLEVNDCNLNQCGVNIENLTNEIESLGYKHINIKDGENYHYTYSSQNNKKKS